MLTCCIQYDLAPGKTAEFEHYARTWARIITRLGGIYHGCFMPGEPPPDSLHFSFAIGRPGPENVAISIFSFKDLAGYEYYRHEAPNDPECDAITAFHNETQCFTGYQRSFLTPLEL